MLQYPVNISRVRVFEAEEVLSLPSPSRLMIKKAGHFQQDDQEVREIYIQWYLAHVRHLLTTAFYVCNLRAPIQEMEERMAKCMKRATALEGRYKTTLNRLYKTKNDVTSLIVRTRLAYYLWLCASNTLLSSSCSLSHRVPPKSPFEGRFQM